MEITEQLPFRDWDGEGITVGEHKHRFTLLATDDEHICNHPKRLGTVECFEFLTKKRERCINIWYFFDYDVNCILIDIPLRILQELCRSNEVTWRGWKIRYIPGKIFSLSRGSRRFNSFDVSGFFQKSFIAACKSFGLSTVLIEEGKKSRADFASWPVRKIIAYNQAELNLLQALMTKVREYLAEHAPKTQWYGPGAVSSQWLEKVCNIKMEKHRNWPEEMNEAISHAYFGGRIDVSKIGEFPICHSYDINSAYPAGMINIPMVKGWKYATHDNLRRNDDFALYHVRWKVPASTRWCPFPWRSSTGSILYPPQGEGWYFGCEVLAAERMYPKAIQRIEAWLPVRYSFFPLRDAIVNAYKLRQELKKLKNPAELAYKLILNAIYGKFAQKQANNKARKPRFQNYVWAGYTTATARAKILDVLRSHGEKIIAIATDSVFCTEPVLGTDENKELGEWGYEGNFPTLILMPGVYAQIKDGDTKKYRQRGFPIPLNYGYVLRKWGCTTKHNTEGFNTDVAESRRFITFRQAIAKRVFNWGYFEDIKKDFSNVSIFGFSKRFPSPLDVWKNSWQTKNMLATPSKSSEPMSHKYRIPTFQEETEREYVGEFA